MKGNEKERSIASCRLLSSILSAVTGQSEV
jgi:hypothetical protein